MLNRLHTSMVGITGFLRSASTSSTTTGRSSTGEKVKRSRSCSMMTMAVSGNALPWGARWVPRTV